MLSSNVTYTPRPRPPARRRSTPLKRGSSPPPSYVAALTPERTSSIPTILGSPMVATYRNIGWGDDLSPEEEPESEKEWMNERSREELEELLGKAGSLIKERENDLGLASAVCKSLYENNALLKTKHQALLARLPSSPSPSPSPEPFARPSSRYNISLNDSPIHSKSQIRKISVSSTDISHLEDQNAELLDKLEKLEAHSEKVDQTGRRELKRLEKEILQLREELEKTQARSEELEEKAKAELVSKADEVFRQREERHAKLRAMRGPGARNSSPESDSEVQDFAPRGSSFGGPSAGFPIVDASGAPVNRSVSAPEPSLISQLLEKIKELEQTNSKIMAQQAETTVQLNAMQRETEQITRVYDCFGEGQITEADGSSDDGRPHDETIRFRTLQQNLGVQLHEAEGKEGPRSTLGVITAPRARKSVVGLFDTLEQQAANIDGLPAPPSMEMFDSKRSLATSGLISPAPSSYGLPSPTSMHGGAGLTLGDELGGELDAFNTNASYGHARSGSLYDLMKVASSTSHTPTHSLEVPTMSRDTTEDSQRAYPPSLGRIPLRLSVEPPSPEKRGSIGRYRSERMAETLRLRTNHWVNKRFPDSPSRPRAPTLDDHLNLQDEDGEDLHRPLTPLSLRLTSAFDAAVQNVKQATADTSILSLDEELDQEEEGEGDEAAQGAVSVQPKLEVLQGQQPKGLGAILLELWLWLQFGIVVLFFLWAMAKRGPKSVLGEPGQRRAVSGSSARS